MRIISGNHKGRRIVAPKNLPVRPTTDRSKESLFNILENRYYFHGKSSLDIFSGTGNISYEFSSRGIKDVTSVDSNFNCINFIRNNSEKLDLNINTIHSDAISFLKKCTRKFNFIFADPPYSYQKHSEIVKIIRDRKLVEQNGCLIIEHDETTYFTDNNIEQKKYGTVNFSIFSF